MKRASGFGGILVALLMAVAPAYAFQIDLFQYALNLGGTVFGPYGQNSKPVPGLAGVDLTGFDAGTGLGTIRVSATGDPAGQVPYVGLFVDHEIDEPSTGFFFDRGEAVGTPAPFQSWEIDEPGFSGGPVLGDIFDNFENSALDNQVFDGVSGISPDDVSMALAWELSAARFASKELRFDFFLSRTTPTGFHLAQHDPGTGGELFFSSRFSVVPEPATLALLALGLAAMGFFAGGGRYGKGAGSS